MPRSLRKAVRPFLLLAAALPLGACNTVEYYEKEHLVHPIMDLAEEATEVHWYQKVYYSIEGAAGGIGTSAGGGCGCY
ncbi:MAG: DUF4266 domain-containing protein [bacterium]|nr:DUF4266 domain-containing protein [bacterium]